MEKELTRQEQEEIFLRAYAETGKQIEAAKTVNWSRAKAWRFVKKIREKEPERLKSTVEEAKAELQEQDIQQASQNPKTALKPIQPKESTLKEEKNKEKSKKATMGFRAEVSKIEFWRTYADATDTEIGVMCTTAIDEYIQRHELTADQKEIIDIKMKALEAEKLIRKKQKI